MQTVRSVFFLVLVLVFSLMVVSCGEHGYSESPNHLTILTGSENKPLEPMLKNWASKNQKDLDIKYKGSIGIMEALQKDVHDFDVVWPSPKLI
jgi:Ca-activated chloride channel family protein